VTPSAYKSALAPCGLPSSCSSGMYMCVPEELSGSHARPCAELQPKSATTTMLLSTQLVLKQYPRLPLLRHGAAHTSRLAGLRSLTPLAAAQKQQQAAARQ
jgi:hypothetical protein